jgi:hypothetical protein
MGTAAAALAEKLQHLGSVRKGAPADGHFSAGLFEMALFMHLFAWPPARLARDRRPLARRASKHRLKGFPCVSMSDVS